MREITVQQAAEILHVSPDRVRKFIRSGRLPAEKAGGVWFVKPEDLQAFASLPRREGYPKGRKRLSIGIGKSLSTE